MDGEIKEVHLGANFTRPEVEKGVSQHVLPSVLSSIDPIGRETEIARPVSQEIGSRCFPARPLSVLPSSPLD